MSAQELANFAFGAQAPLPSAVGKLYQACVSLCHRAQARVALGMIMAGVFPGFIFFQLPRQGGERVTHAREREWARAAGRRAVSGRRSVVGSSLAGGGGSTGAAAVLGFAIASAPPSTTTHPLTPLLHLLEREKICLLV